MAEGYLNLFNPGLVVRSGGIEVHGVNPLAVKVMAEDRVDISSHTSNLLEEYIDIPFDVVITVCDHAHEVCPVFPSNAIQIHQNFTDPSKQDGPEEDILPAYRKARDAIKAYMQLLSESNFFILT